MDDNSTEPYSTEIPSCALSEALDHDAASSTAKRQTESYNSNLNEEHWKNSSEDEICSAMQSQLRFASRNGDSATENSHWNAKATDLLLELEEIESTISTCSDIGIPQTVDRITKRAMRVYEQGANRLSTEDPLKPKVLSKLGSIFNSLFEANKAVGLIDQVITCQRQSVSLTPATDQALVQRLSNLGRSLWSRFQSLGEIHDLDQAIAYQSQVVQIITETHADRASQLSVLGSFLSARFECLRQISDLDRAIENNIQAVLLTADGHEDKLNLLYNLGSTYLLRARHLNVLSDIDQAIEYLSRGVQITPDEHPLKSDQLGNLGTAHQLRFGHLGELADIDKAVEYQIQSLLLTPEEYPNKYGMLSNLEKSLQHRYEHMEGLQDLDRVIAYQVQVVRLTPGTHSAKATSLESLGDLFSIRFQCLEQPSDIDKAIDNYTQAILLTPDSHTAKLGLLCNLGTAYLRRSGNLNMIADIDKAIEYIAGAVQSIPDAHPLKSTQLGNLGTAHQLRFEHLGELEDINQAIEHQTQSLLLIPEEHPEKTQMLFNLKKSLEHRYEHSGELKDLNRAIECQTLVIQLTPDTNPSKMTDLGSLGNLLSTRFQRLGEISDIDKAIESETQAILLTPDGHTDKLSLLYNVGTSYLRRYEHMNTLSDADQAINYLAQTGQITPENHPLKPTQLSNLASSYWFRFLRLKNVEDVDYAIEYQAQAVKLTQDGHATKPGWISNLGLIHCDRFELLGQQSDIEMALKHHIDSLLLTPEGHKDRPYMLHCLGASHIKRYLIWKNLENLDEGVRLLTEAVLLTPEGEKDRPIRLQDLGTSYRHRFEQQGELSDIDEAIKYQTQSVILKSVGYAHISHWFINLGNSHLLRFNRLREQLNLDTGILCFQNAAQCNHAHPYTRFNASRNWARNTFKSRGYSRLPAYASVMELVPKVVWLGARVGHRYTDVHSIDSIAVEAAAAAISEGNYAIALEWLESGRSIVWNQTLQLRTPLDDLSEAYPSIAQEFKQIAQDLEPAASPQHNLSAQTNTSQYLEAAAQHHRRRTEQFESLIDDIRQKPHFHDFMKPKKASDLLRAAQDGPVVVVNIHTTRCDALVLLPGADDVRHVPLSKLSCEEVLKLRVELNQSLQSVGYRQRRPHWDEEESGDSFQGILATLWHKIAEPVLNSLGYTEKMAEHQLPHVTWCTTGDLSFLPIHAAGRYDGSRPNVFDLVYSSYIPTLSALLSSRSRTSTGLTDLLTVGQEATPGCGPLPGTKDELDSIQKHAEGLVYERLEGEKATTSVVLDAMEKYGSVHLACHALQNVVDPTKSGFYLHDGLLSLANITKKPFKDKGLAFLSACQTATGDTTLPDEAVHLAAGMLVAGYPSVIATMWSIKDSDAPLISDHVYAQLINEGKLDSMGAAKALHSAVGILRAQVGEKEFARWVPYVHMGV